MLYWIEHDQRQIKASLENTERYWQMYHVTADEAKTQLAKLIEAALHGEEVIIAASAEHAVRLVPVLVAQKGRKAGSAKGLITMAEDFDAPLADFDEYSA
jgi:antitoxin (DNA-binding transcriptional repressor) of toxin-antitoxin stability system